MTVSLHDLARSVAAADTLESLTRTLLQVLEAVTGLESVYLTRVDDERHAQQVLFARNARPGRLDIPEGLAAPWGDSLCRRAIDERTPFNPRADEIWGDLAAVNALGVRTFLSEPVRDNEGALLGTLCGVSDRRVELDAGTRDIVNLFARLIAHQFGHEQRMAKLQHDVDELSARATTDALTGIANRQGLLNGLLRLLAEAARRHERVGVVFIDLDEFKRINDLHGHRVGDQFLAAMAARLVAATRAGDLLARYGGDEFVVCGRLDGPEGGAATGAAIEASRRAMGKRFAAATRGRFELDAVVIDYAGASVGTAVSGPGETAEALLQRADAAMYETKAARRRAARAAA